jgi:simple sugar transport system substrate-binding protein
VTTLVADGRFHPYTGPISNQAGEVIVPEGTTMTNEELAGVNAYVEGIGAALPN